MKQWQKITLSVLVSAALLFGGFIILLLVSFAIGKPFYVNLVLIGLITSWLFAMFQVWGVFKTRTRGLAFVAALVLFLSAVLIYEAPRIYEASFEQISEQGVDLTLYEPFRDETLAVSLFEPSTLKLSDSLPRLDGATALYPLYSAFARAVYPENNYPAYLSSVAEGDLVVCSNTVNAYERLIYGETDIIFVAGPSAEQRRIADKMGKELKLTPIGREAFIFFVNSNNPVDALTTDEIQRIYTGEIINWSDLGGNNESIRAYQRPENSGSQTALQRLMNGYTLMVPPGEDVAGGMGGIIRRVSSYRNRNNAIGYSFLFFASEMVRDNKIKLLQIDGIAPSKENIANGTYPHAAEFYAVTAGTVNPNVQEFIDWILSEQGQYLVDKTGYTALGAGR